MYSASYATDCQEKRLLILAATIADGNLGVKNFSYLALPSCKRAIAPAFGAPESALCHISEPQVITEVFPKMEIGTGNPQALRVRSKCFRFDAPWQIRTKWGYFPPKSLLKNGTSKIRFFRCS